MGLEIAEFLIQVEEELGLAIGSDDLDQSKDWTVGDMVDLIEKKIREKETKEILSEQYPLMVAEEVKNTLESFSHNLPSGFGHETLMSELFPENRAWDQFLESDDPVVLEIESAASAFSNHQRIVKNSLALYSLFLVTCGTGAIFLFHNSTYIVIPLLLILLVPISYLWWKITKRKIIGLNAKSLKQITFADLVQRVTKERRRYLKTDGLVCRCYTREEIEQLVIKMICDVTAIKIEKITLDRTLVRDLGMG